MPLTWHQSEGGKVLIAKSLWAGASILAGSKSGTMATPENGQGQVFQESLFLALSLTLLC